jgi:small subunit ribosomal protein S9
VEKSILTVGRRKEAVARVRLVPGNGKIIINGKEIKNYFGRVVDRLKAAQSLEVTSTAASFDVLVKIHGGGPTGQSEAIRLGIARALVKTNDKLKPILRQNGYLTRDSRMVERKKYGHPKARKRFQFSKR